jgi:cytoskeleton protein RodZ
MNSNTTENEGTPSDATIDGPGSQLRKARERLGLEQSTVASHLNLSHSIIQSLEWDDYENLPSPVFVKGYLRNYARLVKVDEDVVVSAFLDLNPATEQSPLPKSQPEDVAKEMHGDPRLFRYITWAVVLILGVMVFFWWQGRIDEPETALDTLEEETELLPGFSDSPELTDEGSQSLALPEADDSSSEVEAPAVFQDSSTSSESETVSAPAESTSYESQSEPDQVVDITDSSTSMQMEESVLTSTAEPETTSVAEAPTMVSDTPVESVAPSGSVLFEFIGNCWVDVRDASGRARILGVKSEGLRRILNVNAGPFKVVIGDINAVKVSINGTPYNLRAHARGKVARFTLDPSRL